MEKQISHVIDYALAVRGVYGRNRTEKFTTVKLRRIAKDAEEVELRALSALADNELAAMKFKSGRWVLERREIEVQKYADGATIEMHQPFTHTKTLLTGGK